MVTNVRIPSIPATVLNLVPANIRDLINTHRQKILFIGGGVVATTTDVLAFLLVQPLLPVFLKIIGLLTLLLANHMENSMLLHLGEQMFDGSPTAMFAIGRIFAFMCAVTAAWLYGRNLTFREERLKNPQPMVQEYGKFVLGNGIGAVVNMTTGFVVKAALGSLGLPVALIGVIAIIAGSGLAMPVNFMLSKLAFSRKRKTSQKEEVTA